MKNKTLRPSKVTIIANSFFYLLSLLWQTSEFLGLVFGLVAFAELNEWLLLKKKTTLAKCSFLLPPLMLGISYLRWGAGKNLYLAMILVLLIMAVTYIFNYKIKK